MRSHIKVSFVFYIIHYRYRVRTIGKLRFWNKNSRWKRNDYWRLFNYHMPPFQKLLKMSQRQSRSAYKQALLDLIDYLDRKVFSVHLIDPNRVTAHEIFCYSDGNQAKHHIRGSLRAAIHTGLSDPQMYLDVSEVELRTNSSCTRFQLTELTFSYRAHCHIVGTCPKLFVEIWNCKI